MATLAEILKKKQSKPEPLKRSTTTYSSGSGAILLPHEDKVMIIQNGVPVKSFDLLNAVERDNPF
jgi:hypothetical protein